MQRGNGVRRMLVVAATGAALWGCDGGSTAPLEPCTGPVELTSTGGTQPTFDWRPRCGAASLTMPLPPSQGIGLLWGLAADERLIPPGVRYGTVPEGTTELSPAVPMPEDASYTVVLRASDGSVIAEEYFGP